MSQIQSGYNYNTTTNKIVTAENLNGHVSNAILLPGSISEQQTLVGSLDPLDSILLLDASSNILVNTNIQSFWDILPTDLTVTTLTNKVDEDILVNQNSNNTHKTKTVFNGDVHIGKLTDYSNLPDFLFNHSQWGEAGVLSVNGAIVNAHGSVGAGAYTSDLVFGYQNDRQPNNTHRGNNFWFYGHKTSFIGTDNSNTGYSNIAHPVDIFGSLSVKDPDGAATANSVTLNVEGNIYGKDLVLSGNITVQGGTTFQATTIKQIVVAADEVIVAGGHPGDIINEDFIDVWTDSNVFGLKQALITLPDIIIDFANSDNEGEMKLKIDLIAKEDGAAVEHVIARYGYTGDGPPLAIKFGAEPYNFKIRTAPWQKILTPSNIDLTNKKLSIRVWAANWWGGDNTILKASEGFMSVTSIATGDNAPITTSYVSTTQVNSSTTAFEGGAKIDVISMAVMN